MAKYYFEVLAIMGVQKEKPMPIVYKEVKLDHGYRKHFIFVSLQLLKQ